MFFFAILISIFSIHGLFFSSFGDLLQKQEKVSHRVITVFLFEWSATNKRSSQSVDHRMWPGNKHMKNFFVKHEVIKSRSKGMLTTTFVGWSACSHSSYHRLHLLQQSAELISEKVDLHIRVGRLIYFELENVIDFLLN